MEQITVTVYNFKELDENVQNKVIDNHRYWNVEDDFWSEHILEDWREKLEAFGFVNPEVFFSGFSSQGDGACFTCDAIDFVKYTDSLIMQANTYSEAKWLQVFGLMYDRGLLSAKITHVSRYSHENSTSLEYENLLGSDLLYERLDPFADEIREKMVKLSRAIYAELEAEYHSQIEDSVVSESLMDSETKFLASGKVWN